LKETKTNKETAAKLRLQLNGTIISLALAIDPNYDAERQAVLVGPKCAILHMCHSRKQRYKEVDLKAALIRYNEVVANSAKQSHSDSSTAAFDACSNQWHARPPASEQCTSQGNASWASISDEGLPHINAVGQHSWMTLPQQLH
jgi:hypothetical protein